MYLCAVLLILLHRTERKNVKVMLAKLVVVIVLTI